MKSFLSQALLVALAATATSFGQTEAKTKPVGYETITLNANQFNVIGLRLQGASVAAGSLDAVGTASVTDNDASFASLLSASKTYVLEITSGTLSGLTVEATWTSGNVLNTPDNLQSAGITTGTTYNLRPALTLEEIFGTTNSVLTKGFSAATADLVWLPDGMGGYKQYFLNNSSQWRQVSPAMAASNVPIFYTDAVYVQKRGQGATLQVSGEVKTTGSTFPIISGFNLVSTIYPAGVTLQNFGLEDDVQKGFSAATADIVWVPNGAGGYNQYFLNNSSQWRQVSPAVAAPSDLPLSAGVMIQRKGGAATFDVAAPSVYTNL